MNAPQTVETLLKALVGLRSLILLVALYNFGFIWTTASNWTLGCMICPWYSEWSFTDPPTLILLAACGLRLGRRFGYFIAIVGGGVVVVEGLVVSINLIRYGEFLFLESLSWLARFDVNPFLSLHTQHILATSIVVLAAYSVTMMFRAEKARL